MGFEPGDYLYSFDTPEDSRRICSMDQVLAKADSLTQGTVNVYVNRYNENKTDVVQVLIKDVPLTREFVETYFTTSLSEQSGLQIGDEILKVNSTRVHTGHELRYEIMNQGHSIMKLTVLRNGETQVLNVRVPNFQESGATFGDMDFLIYAESDFNLGIILKHTWFRSCSTVKMVFDSLFGLFSGRYSVEAVSGPVGITKTISDAAQTGWLNVLYLVVVISINLGIMNLLPFPALDGGHLMIYFIEVIRRKPMKRELEGMINFIGLLILLSLAVLIAIKDIISL
jgi:regulator of sigma E protease